MSTFLERFDQYWEQQMAVFLSIDTPIILGISGGVDSVVLAYVLANKGWNVKLAHCNFHLRQQESMRDEHFVRNFAEKLHVDFILKDVDTVAYAKQHRLGIEEAARNIRYEWFEQLSVQYGNAEHSAPIMVAHHSNDSIETLLINFFRGCGISGLHGILPVQRGVFRPLLFASRNEIIQYALVENLQWVEDSTNKDSHYLRNFFRNEIIPEMKEHIPSVENNIRENITRFGEVEMVYKQYFDNLRKQLVKENLSQFEIEINAIKECKPINSTLFEIFQPFGFTPNQTNELYKLLFAETGAYLVSSTHEVFKDRTHLFIRSLRTNKADVFEWLEGNSELDLEDGLLLQLVETATMDAMQVILDKNKLSFPLTVRHWQEGDFFYPIGMSGKKKLAKYFVDLKIPRPEKDRIWLLVSGDAIVWVIGYRADRRFTEDVHTSEKMIIKLLKK